jgi:hypothetical protein
VPMLAECLDAVIGVDTHRDTHPAEIAHPSGAVIAACSIPNTSGGYAQLLAWACQHAPGPRLVISIEGTRSYGAGLARAAAAGLVVTECEQPTRKTRRGKGKSDPIDPTHARLAKDCGVEPGVAVAKAALGRAVVLLSGHMSSARMQAGLGRGLLAETERAKRPARRS